MNVPGQDVLGNLQDLMSSQGSVPLLKVWNHVATFVTIMCHNDELSLTMS